MTKSAISWYSNSLNQPTGYGTQSKQVISRLVRAGHKVAMLSNYGCEGVNQQIETGFGKIPHYARGMNQYSTDVLPLNHAHWSAENPGLPNFLITLYDVWVLDNPALDSIPIASWVPIDHQPAPPKVLDWLKKPNVLPVAMSQFGKQMIENAGLECEYVPHAVETSIFRPSTKMSDGGDSVDFVGGKDKFVVGMNFANKAGGFIHRKAVAENFLAFALFASKHDDVLLYIHSEPFGKQSGFQLPNILQACGVAPDKVKFVDPIAYSYGIHPGDEIEFYIKEVKDDNRLTLTFGEPIEKTKKLYELKKAADEGTSEIFNATIKHKRKNGALIELTQEGLMALVPQDKFGKESKNLKTGDNLLVTVYQVDPVLGKIYAKPI